MSYIRKIAVQAVVNKGYSPEEVIDIFGLSRSCIYDWLRRYRAEGWAGLETRKAPGSEALIDEEMEPWLRETVLNSTPVDHGYDTRLWTRAILAECVHKRFGVRVSGRTVSWHLRRLGLSYQKPDYRAVEQQPERVDFFLNDTFPRIQRLAERMGAQIVFEDEAGVKPSVRSGRTRGERGHPPEVVVNTQRAGYNILSTVTAEGEMHYSLAEKSVNSERYLAFLKQVLKGCERPVILIADRAAFHKSKEVSEFVRAHRHQIRVFFLPSHCPKLNPDEQVWQEIKDNKLGKQPIKNKRDLKTRLRSELVSLQRNVKRIKSFFLLPDTQYAAS
jgi:transposase